MSKKVLRVKETLSKSPDPEYLEAKSKQGWRLIALIWEKDVQGNEEAEQDYGEEIPYGLALSETMLTLEEDPSEMEVLSEMLDLIVRDKPLSEVADLMNEKGFRMRSGREWTQISVFNMLPRLIETGHRISSTRGWRSQGSRFRSVEFGAK